MDNRALRFEVVGEKMGAVRDRFAWVGGNLVT
jgi:hypothetical protein